LTTADNDRWPDDMIRLLREQRQPTTVPEPNALEALAGIGEELARYGAFALFIAAIAAWWIITL
jgi:hypothetical protein